VGVSLVADSGLPIHAELFGEDQARYLIAVQDAQVDQIEHDAAKAGVLVRGVGVAGGQAVEVADTLSVGLDALRQAHEGWMPAYMSGQS
jgi:phosphoribosylformylglycinamidine synthase